MFGAPYTPKESIWLQEASWETDTSGQGGPAVQVPHSLQRGPFVIALGPWPAPGGPSWDGWFCLGPQTFQKRVFGCRKPRMRRVHLAKGSPPYRGLHSLQRCPFAIALWPWSTPGGPSWDGWFCSGPLTLQKSAFGCRKPCMRRVHLAKGAHRTGALLLLPWDPGLLQGAPAGMVGPVWGP